MDKVQKETAYTGKGDENLLVQLKKAQATYGYVPEEFMLGLADSLDIPVNDVYGVVSFYSFLSARPLGRHVIRICRSLPCYLKHCHIIIETLSREIGVKPGETTPDGRFSLQLTNCIGACDEAPAMMINNDIHVNLTPEKISQILADYK